MSWHAWEEVVNSLELETAMEEIQPSRTGDVHGRAQHFLWEGLAWSEFGSGHGEVRQGDLSVERHGDHVGDEEEDQTAGVGGDGSVHDEVAEPVPEEDLAGEFEPAVPPCGTFSWTEAEYQMLPGEAVEVEAAEGEDGIV